MAGLAIHARRIELARQISSVRGPVSVRDRAMREGVAVVTGQRIARLLGERHLDVPRLEGEGKRAAGFSHGSFGFLRERRPRAERIAIAPLAAAAILLDKVGGKLDLFPLTLRRKEGRHRVAVAMRTNAHAGVTQLTQTSFIKIEILPARRRAGESVIEQPVKGPCLPGCREPPVEELLQEFGGLIGCLMRVG